MIVNVNRRRKINFIRYARILPYFIFGAQAITFYVLSFRWTNEHFKSIFLNLSAASIFIILVYLFYELITSVINKIEQLELNEHIKNKVHNDIFYILYSFKKYFHGYNSQTNTYEYISEIIKYKNDQIESLLKNQKFLGFQIFKKLDQEIFSFQRILDSHLVISKIPNIKLITLIRIVNDLQRIESFFRNVENYTRDNETAIEFKIMQGIELHPSNRKDRVLLMKKTKIEDIFVVYDSGTFDEQDFDNLNNFYILKRNKVTEISIQISELFNSLKFWFTLDKKDIIPEKRMRKIKGFYSGNTGLQSGEEVFSEDIIDTRKKEFDCSGIETSAKRKLTIYCESDNYLNNKIPIDIFISETYGDIGVSHLEFLIMKDKGWIKEVGDDIEITKKGFDVCKNKN